MLLNNVLAGSEYTMVYSAPQFRGPPQGYDSVRIPSLQYGTIPQGLTCFDNQVYGKPGKDLNYDELVVYNNHAIRPAYLVMYELVSN